MSLLVLHPGNRNLRYACFTRDKAKPVFAGVIKDYRGGAADAQALGERVAELWERAEKRRCPLSAVAVEVCFGGREFPGPTLADAAALDKLRVLAAHAPLHLPVVISLVGACQQVLPALPVVLVFQTSFFADLPARENSYGIDPEWAASMGLRRFGYYGLYHDAACSRVGQARRQQGLSSEGRVISICLDANHELTAAYGRKPVLVTSGATPLEGLPGRTSAGQMDPSIVLMLARELKWGPEQINRMLIQQSGLLGLTGRPMTMQSLLASKSPANTLARDVMQYRTLLACGSGIAALGGLDTIVFSGKYAAAGQILGPWLCGQLARNPGLSHVKWEIMDQSAERIVADLALTTLAATSADQAA